MGSYLSSLNESEDNFFSNICKITRDSKDNQTFDDCMYTNNFECIIPIDEPEIESKTYFNKLRNEILEKITLEARDGQISYTHYISPKSYIHKTCLYREIFAKNLVDLIKGDTTLCKFYINSINDCHICIRWI